MHQGTKILNLSLHVPLLMCLISLPKPLWLASILFFPVLPCCLPSQHFFHREYSEPLSRQQLTKVPKPKCLPGPSFKVQASISGSFPASLGSPKWEETTLLCRRGDCNPLVTGGLCNCSSSFGMEYACHASHWGWMCYSLQSAHTIYVKYYTIFGWKS